MSFKDLKPEFKQKLQHILDEFATATKENEQLKTQIINMKIKHKEELSQLQKKNKTLRSQNEQLSNQISQKQSNPQQLIKVNSYEAHTIPSIEQYKSSSIISPNLCGVQHQQNNNSDIELFTIQSRIKELLPDMKQPEVQKQITIQPNVRQNVQEYTKTSNQYVSQDSNFSFVKNPTRHSTPEEITQEVRQCLPDLKYFESRMSSLQFISFSEDTPKQEQQQKLRIEPKLETQSVDQALQYSVVDQKQKVLENSLKYDILHINNVQNARRTQQSNNLYENILDVQKNQQQQKQIDQSIQLTNRVQQQLQSERVQQIEQQKATTINHSLNSNGYKSSFSKHENRDIQDEDLELETFLPQPQELQEFELTQLNNRITKSKPIQLTEDEKKEIMTQSKLQLLEVKKSVIKKQNTKNDYEKFIRSATPELDESNLLKVSSARVLEDEKYHQNIDIDLIQRQKIKNSLTQMEEDELDGLIQLLNSGN